LFLGDGGWIEIVSSFAPEVRYATCNQSEQGSKTLLFLTNKTKVQILEYGQMTGKVNGSGVLFPLPSKKKNA